MTLTRNLLLTFIVLGSACTSPRPQSTERNPSTKQPAKQGADQSKDDQGRDGSADGTKKPGIITITPWNSDDDKGDQKNPPNGDEDEFETVDSSRPNLFEFTLESPRNWQVFQRQTKELGNIKLAFDLAKVPSSIKKPSFLRVKMESATDWKTFKLEQGGNRVEQELSYQAGGWYQVQVQLFDADKKFLASAKAENVGVGEVFIIAGQSNSTNCGDTITAPKTGKVVSTDGAVWKIAQDPQIGAHDITLSKCNLGSNWPATGDYLYGKFGVPIAFASTGYSGTSIAQWLPNADPKQLFEYTLNRVTQLGAKKFRALLWHQGENDSYGRTNEDTYYQNLKTIVEQMRVKSNWSDMPWLVAQATYCADYHYDRPWGRWDPVRNAQAKMWTLPNVFPRPDTDDLTGSYRAYNDTNCHFSATGLAEAGRLWGVKIEAFLQGQF